MMECVAIEEGDENKVLEEMRAGYMLNDKVLRPAQVKVGKED
jgi:molecular chaperone GrpE (heat shock protein)